MDKRKIAKIILIVLSIGLAISAIATVTLALFTNDEYAANPDTYSTGILSIEAHSKSNTISLTNALPMTKEEAMRTEPYIFTIRNTGNLDYKFNIKLLSISSNTISPNYINVQVNDNYVSNLQHLNNSEIMNNVILAAGEYIDISIRVWLDIDTPNSELGKSFESKIVTDGQAVSNLRNTLMTANTNTGTYLRSDLDRELISSVTFVDNNNIPTSATHSYDVSYSMDGSVMMWYGTANSRGLYDVYIGSKSGTTIISSGAQLFSNLKNATLINLANIDTSKATNMHLMFANSSSLTTLDLSNLNTENVTTMHAMFYNCNALITLDLSNFNTENVTTMNSMFSGCTSLNNLNLSGFTTSNVTTMGQMFRNCYSLTSLNLSDWDFSKVTDMNQMFHAPSTDMPMKLKTVGDTSQWNVSNVTDMSGLFANCPLLEDINVTNWDVSNVTNFQGIFQMCTSLEEIDVSKWNTSSATNMAHMFNKCEMIKILDLSGFDMSNVTNMRNMFTLCKQLKTIYVSDKWDASNVTESSNMFYMCDSLVGSAGTKYNIDYVDKTYARVDKGTTRPGYLTLK